MYLMSKHDIDKKYVSPFDKFLFGFDSTHAKTPSQLAEIKKYQRIFDLRDNKNIQNTDPTVWKEF